MVTDLLVSGGRTGEFSARADLSLAPVQMLCSKNRVLGLERGEKGPPQNHLEKKRKSTSEEE
jgi:hypothetical protein